jgi:hypothetical protein
METQQVQQRKEEAIHETFITQNQPLDAAEAVEYLDAEDPTDSLEDILIQVSQNNGFHSMPS